MDKMVPEGQPERWTAEQFGAIRAARLCVRGISEAAAPRFATQVGVSEEDCEEIREQCGNITHECSVLMDKFESMMFERIRAQAQSDSP